MWLDLRLRRQKRPALVVNCSGVGSGRIRKELRMTHVSSWAVVLYNSQMGTVKKNIWREQELHFRCIKL